MKRIPPRLSIILARQKPIAVIISRGPSSWYHVILWDTSKDTFEHGAWFKGRIYEDRCGLSYDGKLFVYFALQGNKWNSSYQGSWTAVSRPPWLYALTLWPEGSTWSGGGYFLGNRLLALETSAKPHPEHPCIGLKIIKGEGREKVEYPDIPEAEWKGFDQKGYPIYTLNGKLFRKYKGQNIELANFNGLSPNPQEAPSWAKTPLQQKI